MNDEVGHRMAALIREYLKQQADIQSLLSILARTETIERAPHSWIDVLTLLRETPQYKRFLSENEPLVLEIERLAN